MLTRTHYPLLILLPLAIFELAWCALIVASSLQIAEWTQGNIQLLTVLWVVSTVSFGAGYAVVLAVRARSGIRGSLRGELTAPSNWILYGLASTVVVLSALNVFFYGLPPMFRWFGVETPVYAEYGRFKGVLFPAASALLALSCFEQRDWRRRAYVLIGVGTLLLYVARGPLMLAVVEWAGVSLLYSRYRRETVLVSASAVVLALVAFGIIGELRSGPGYFREVMEIREYYRDVPSALLWLIGYVGFPAENLVALVSEHDRWELGRRTWLGLLPAFLGSTERVDEYYLSLLPNVLNNVPTYLGWAWLDAGWVGVVALNGLYGVVGGLLVLRAPGHGGLIAVLYYAALLTIFFNDHLLWFPTVVQGLFLGAAEVSMRHRAERRVARAAMWESAGGFGGRGRMVTERIA